MPVISRTGIGGSISANNNTLKLLKELFDECPHTVAAVTGDLDSITVVGTLDVTLGNSDHILHIRYSSNSPIFEIMNCAGDIALVSTNWLWTSTATIYLFYGDFAFVLRLPTNKNVVGLKLSNGNWYVGIMEFTASALQNMYLLGLDIHHPLDFSVTYPYKNSLERIIMAPTRIFDTFNSKYLSYFPIRAYAIQNLGGFTTNTLNMGQDGKLYYAKQRDHLGNNNNWLLIGE